MTHRMTLPPSQSSTAADLPSAPDLRPAAVEPPAVASGRKAAMRFIMLTVLIDMLAIGIIIPVLPALVGTFTSNPAEHALWLGVVSFAFGLANFFGAPVLGALSDSYGRRPVLLIGFCGLAFNFFLTALSTALWMLVAVRLVGGAMQANAAVANAYAADVTPPEQRAKAFGMLGAMFGIGFILGPVMGGLLGAIHLQLPFFVAGGLALLNLAYGYFVLPESLPAEKRRPFDWRKANPLASLRSLSQLQGVGLLVAVIGFSALAQFIMYTLWVLYTTFKFGWSTADNGWSMAAVGVASVIVQGGLLGRLAKRYSPRQLALSGILSSLIAYMLWGAATQGWMMIAIVFANLLGFTVTATIQGVISRAADERSQGQAMGAVSSLNSLMAVLAPVIGAPMLGIVSHYPLGDWHIGAPFYLCAALQAVALVLAVRHFRGERRARLATPTATP
jgi:DHA1 family tetracycline resistance protein-like MFS transporter